MVTKTTNKSKRTVNDKKSTKGFEETLWDTANKLRGTVESSEYKHVVLSLIFLKFASDKFEARKKELVAEGKGKYTEMVEFYAMRNVFYLREVLKRKLELYEGRVEHMYLDTKGYVTIAVGHMIPNVGAAKKLNFVHHKTNVKANEADIISEYDRVKKQVKGLPASTYRKHTKLKISNLEIESLTNQHIVSFGKELKRIYGSEQFEGFPKSVRLAH